MTRTFGCVVVLLCVAASAADLSRNKLEQLLSSQGKMLLQARYKPKKGMNARGVVFNLETLKTHELYLRSRSGSEYVFVGSDGAVTGRVGGRMSKGGELFISNVGGALFIDDNAFELDAGKWDVFWAASAVSKPTITKVDYPKRNMVDGFMRKNLLEGSVWVVSSGKWQLMKHGGGMATTLAEERNYNFARAANPFTVIGSGKGFLTYGRDDWTNSYVEGRFFFGRSKRGNVPHFNDLPVSDMMVAFGALDERLVAFGWDRHANAFVLKEKMGKASWQTIWKTKNRRPPVTNWVRIGLDIRNGCVARAWLDGAMVHDARLKFRVAGPFHICCEGEEMEVDDIRAYSLPKPPTQGQKVFLPSRQFAGKREMKRADPKEFGMWARGDDTFLRKRENIDDDWFRATIITRMPLMGDFHYESLPYHKDAGKLQPGLYEFQILTKDPSDPLNLDKLRLAKSFKVMRLEEGWVSNNLEGMDEDNPQFTLRFRRRAMDGDRICIQINGKYVPVTDKISGPVHFAIVRRMPRNNTPCFPKPWHHNLTCNNLTNELFETAPTDWNWLEGAFRMDMRWSCRSKWNFMACGGVGVPAMISKRTFSGDQEHEFFAACRPALPWDAGDASFRLNPRLTKRYKGWSHSRDINFSFCFDGKNLLSGYTVLCGAHDNTETLLMRKGKVVARSKTLLPVKFLDRHWRWFHFRVYKYGNLIHVKLRDDTLFEYRDPEPLDGGHIACWSIRNALSYSREISVAQRVGYVPDVLYVDNDESSNWKPVFRDSVHVTRTGDKAYPTRVTNRMGSGFFAVRRIFSTPIDLRKTPILELPLRPGPEAEVTVHVKVGTQSYFIDIGAPVTFMRSLLTTDYERGEQFRTRVWDKLTIHQKKLRLAKVTPKNGLIRVDLLKYLPHENTKLTEIAIGNTSNIDYLLAGNHGNQAGSYYEVGEPVFRSKSEMDEKN